MKPSVEYFERTYFLTSVSERCAYLPDRRSNLLVLDGAPIGPDYRRLLDEGYRRQGSLIYRPACGACTECKILRVPVNDFRRSKSQRRIWARGTEDFSLDIGTPTVTYEKVSLYRRYLREKHESRDWFVTEDQYAYLFTVSILGEDTAEILIRHGERLVGVGILDCFEDALSSVYFYYDVGYARYSPGVFSSLLEIELARMRGLKYYYLGYYIADCRSMNYKNQFRPCEWKAPGDSEWRLCA